MSSTDCFSNLTISTCNCSTSYVCYIVLFIIFFYRRMHGYPRRFADMPVGSERIRTGGARFIRWHRHKNPRKCFPSHLCLRILASPCSDVVLCRCFCLMLYLALSSYEILLSVYSTSFAIIKGVYFKSRIWERFEKI